MRWVTIIWILVFSFFSYEYAALNWQPERSILMKLQQKQLIEPNLNLSPEPGRPLSLLLGWGGFGIMILMNLYTIRKRVSIFGNLGKLSTWLNFHIFCGLVGPTLIFFHSNFKVRGLVAISFWSMVVSLTSGIIGRYFYVQLSKKKTDYLDESQKWLSKLDRYFEKKKRPLDEEERKLSLQRALVYVGLPLAGELTNPFMALSSALIGDIRLMTGLPPAVGKWPETGRMILKEYALAKRRAELLTPFQRLMGYWHAFHLPFAFFMYIAAAIHIVAALMFGV